MRVLGIDPGLTRCGVAVISGAPGRRLDAQHIGVITTDPDLPLPQRLLLVEAEIESLVALHNPDVVAIERVFSQHNVRSAMGTAQAAAMGFLVAARHGITVATHTPTEVKAAVTGNGRADKAQVTAMVTRILQLPAPPKPADAADAVAIAVCHVWRGAAQAKIDAAIVAVGR
jgi:crossover junction endodeoxyribonuclease RuvC